MEALQALAISLSSCISLGRENGTARLCSVSTLEVITLQEELQYKHMHVTGPGMSERDRANSTT